MTPLKHGRIVVNHHLQGRNVVTRYADTEFIFYIFFLHFSSDKYDNNYFKAVPEIPTHCLSLKNSFSIMSSFSIMQMAGNLEIRL